MRAKNYLKNFVFTLLMLVFTSAFSQTHIFSFDYGGASYRAHPLYGGSTQYISFNPAPGGQTYGNNWYGWADGDVLFFSHSKYSSWVTSPYGVWTSDLDGTNTSIFFDTETELGWTSGATEGIVGNDDYIYACKEYSKIVVRIDRSDPSVYTTHTFTYSAEFAAIQGSKLFVGGGFGSSSPEKLMSCDLDFGNETTIVTATDRIMGIAADAEHVYWRTYNGNVGIADHDGANANTTFITGLASGYNSGILVDDSYIYAMSGSSTISKYNKTTGALVVQVATGVNTRGLCFANMTTPYVWDGETDTDWNTASNWDVGVPDAYSVVSIPDVTNQPVVSGDDFSVWSVDVSADATIDISSGASLTVLSDFNLANGASLIDEGSLTVNGTFSALRTISDDDWHLVSSPVTGQSTSIFTGDYLQSWTENGASWSDITSTSYSLAVLTGYALWPTAGKSSYTFTGTPNTGTKSLTLSYHDQEGGYDGMNLVGNPYPSSIDWSTLHGTYGASYIFNPALDDYVENTADDIAPFQGFFLYTATDGSSYSVSNSNRTHGGSFNKGSTSKNSGLILNATYGEFADKFTLLFDENTTDGFGLYSDAWKIISSGNGVSQVWSVCPDGKLAIDTRPYQESIQLGFANNAAGFYTIGISEIADISTAVLEDTKEDLFHDLTKGAYSFAWDLSDDEDRFILHLGPTGVEESLNNELLIYAHDDALHLKALNGAQPGTLSITDMAGRVLYQSQLTIDGETIVNPGIPAGAYVIRFTSEKNVVTKKVIIN